MEYAPRDEDHATSAAAFSTSVMRRGGCFEVPEVPGIGVELVPGHAEVAPPTTARLSYDGLLRSDGSVLGGVL
jgi:hypothetical protein